MKQQSFLEATKDLVPEDNAPLFKYTTPGDAIDAKFGGRRRGVKTQQGIAIALDVNILESNVVGDKPITGYATIFESGHITQIMDRENLSPGDRFVLRFHSQDRKSHFKKFFFKKVESDEPPDFGEEPPPEFYEQSGHRGGRR